MVHPHHIRVCGVGEMQCSAIVFLIQLRLSEVQLIQSVADAATPLHSLGILRELRDQQQGLQTDGFNNK